jgi:ABC-type multidrug transport system ATPase subunit
MIFDPRMELRAERLTKKFGWKAALDDLSFEAKPGQIIAVLGENGAGKTTFLNVLAGSLRLDAGAVLIDGENYTPRRSDLRHRTPLGGINLSRAITFDRTNL